MRRSPLKSPSATVVVGGNLAASAEILLRLAKVDYCVAGDGEYIIKDLVRILRDRPVDIDRLRATKGICFLDGSGKFEFTDSTLVNGTQSTSYIITGKRDNPPQTGTPCEAVNVQFGVNSGGGMTIMNANGATVKMAA